jgi:hypothetical protein
MQGNNKQRSCKLKMILRHLGVKDLTEVKMTMDKVAWEETLEETWEETMEETWEETRVDQVTIDAVCQPVRNNRRLKSTKMLY